jgi:hypothetical protein
LPDSRKKSGLQAGKPNIETLIGKRRSKQILNPLGTRIMLAIDHVQHTEIPNRQVLR